MKHDVGHSASINNFNVPVSFTFRHSQARPATRSSGGEICGRCWSKYRHKYFLFSPTVPLKSITALRSLPIAAYTAVVSRSVLCQNRLRHRYLDHRASSQASISLLFSGSLRLGDTDGVNLLYSGDMAYVKTIRI